MKKVQVLFFLLLCLASIVSAQEVTGRIVDERYQPIEFANITLLRECDSTFIAGAVSDKNGAFRFMAPSEKSLIHVSALGFKPKTVPSVSFGGDIILQQDAKMLGTVIVKGHRSAYSWGKEGLVTNVAGTPLRLSGSIIDVLKYVPGIIINNEVINVFGKGIPLVYINNRQVRNQDELSRVSSQQIKDIEVIQNPGSEYPSDVRAVVKIRLLKPKGEGVGFGIISSYAQSENSDVSNQIDFSYNNKRLYSFAQYKWNHEEIYQKGYLDQTVHAETLWQQNNELNNQVKNNAHDLTAGLDYTISPKHSMGIKYIVSFNGWHHSKLFTYTQMTANGKSYDELSTHTWTKYNNLPKHQLNAYYNGILGKMSVNLTVDYLFNHDKNTQHNSETSLSQESREISSMSSVRNNMVATKLILGHQLFGGIFRSGVEFVANNRHDDYIIDRTTILSSTLTQLKESQISPFMEYQYKLPFGQFNAGLRFEHVSFKYYEDGFYYLSQSRYFNNLFPSFSLTTKIRKINFSIGYSVKTKRPTYRQLSNNIIYINRFSMQSGNPNLNSEHIHDITAMAQWKYIQAMISWQDDRDAIIYWTEQNPKNTSITTIKYKNQESIKSLTTMIAVAPSLGFWNPRFSIGLRQQWLNLKTVMGTFKLNKPILNIQWSNNIKLPWKAIANIDMNYQSKGNYQNVYSTRNVFSLNLGLTKSFLKERLVLKVEGKDLLHLQKTGNLVYSNQMQLLQDNSFDTRMFKVTLSYHFNTSRSKYKGTEVGNSEKKRL